MPSNTAWIMTPKLKVVLSTKVDFVKVAVNLFAGPYRYSHFIIVPIVPFLLLIVPYLKLVFSPPLLKV